jgi:hypothetical protein
MSAIVSCPACRRALQVPEDFFGQTVQCPDCKETFLAKPPEPAVQVTATPPAPAPAVPSAAPPTWEEPLPLERTSRPRDRDDDDDDDERDDVQLGRRRRMGRPDRGALVLTLGIISLAGSLMSFMLYVVPLWLIPMGLGITGWIIGQRDLRAMREGAMDNTNQAMTLVGMILSIIGFSFSVFVMILSCTVLGIIGVACGVGAFAPPPPGPRRPPG